MIQGLTPSRYFFSPNIKMPMGPTETPIQHVPRFVFLLSGKWPGYAAGHSCLSNSKVKNEWSYTSAPTVMPSLHVQEHCYHILPLTVIFSDCSRQWIVWNERILHSLFTYILSSHVHVLHLYSFMVWTSAPPICLHSVYICYTHMTSWVCLRSIMVCSSTPPIFLYGVPIDRVIVIKKIQHNASF